MNDRKCALEPSRLWSVKPDLVCDVNRRSSTRRKEPTWENYDRRQLQLSRQGYPEEPLGLDRVGQQQVGKSLPTCRARAGKGADMVTLRKHLGHTRRLASAIKQGQSYFHLLQKEEQEEQEEEERQQRRREEQRRIEPRPPSFSSDSDSDSEGWPLHAGTSWSGVNEAWSQSARPLTPLHHSLTSTLLSEAQRKVIYRQLCCLNWLLEALTLDRSDRISPLSVCWDPKDPGQGRTTIKTLKKERAVEKKWEQFVSAKPHRGHLRRPCSSSARSHTQRKSSFVSVASLSALTSTTVGSSSVSLVPGAEEDVESPGAAEETDRPPLHCKLPKDVHQEVKKESQTLQTSSLTASKSGTEPSPQRTDAEFGSKTAKSFRPKSCPAKPPITDSHLTTISKASMLQELKAAFDERVEEMSQSYVDVLELKARERLNSGLRRYRALCHVTESHGLPHHVTCVSQETEAPHSNNKNQHSNNMWLSTLLSSLPEEVRRERAVSRVLEKLSGFAEQQTLRVRPQVFLKVLGGLEPWELCLPELCVAIQIAIEHVVQMPRKEYRSWLCSRVGLPSQLHRTPQAPGEPHSFRLGGTLQTWTDT